MGMTKIGFNISISVESGETRKVMCCTGGNTLAEALSKAFTDGMFYLGRGYEGVQLSVEAACSVCYGTGQVPKGGRTMFATKTCPTCKAKPVAQPIPDPIDVTTGTTVGLKVSVT